MQSILLISAGGIGLIIGSFINALMHRIKNNSARSILSGRSTCPQCKKPIAWYDLIPVVSYIILKGRCRNCKKKISVHYPIVEITTCILFIFTAMHGLSPAILALSLFYMVVLVFTFFYDILYLEVADEIMIPAIAIGLIASFHPTTPTFTSALIGAAIPVTFFLLQIIISKGRWIGGGDLRIGAFMGVILGPAATLTALVLSYIIGSIISIFLLTSKKWSLKSAVPFGPFLVAGTIISYFYAEQIISYYLTFSLV